MNTIIQTQTASDGRKYHAEFDPRFTGAIRRWIERPDGTIEYEEKNGQGRGTTAPEGLYPTQPKPTP